MGFQEIDLHHVGGLVEQALEVAQPPGAVVRGGLRGRFQRGDGMFFGQVEQTQQHAQSGRPAGLVHGFGPSAGQRTHQPALIQQMFDAALDHVALAAVQVGRIGGELPRFSRRVQGDLLPPQVVNPHQPGFVPDPDLAADVFGRHRIIGALELDVAIAVHGARGFFEAGEHHRR
jgi:hypothetical protein